MSLAADGSFIGHSFVCQSRSLFIFGEEKKASLGERREKEEQQQ